MKIFFILASSFLLTSCLSRGLVMGSNITGDYLEKMAQYQQQKEMMQLQNNQQRSGSYCFQLSDGVHCY